MSNGTFVENGYGWGKPSRQIQPKHFELDAGNNEYVIGRHHINFLYDGMPSQCGVGIMHDFSFHNIGDNTAHELGVQFAEDLKEINCEAGAKLLASAVIGSKLYHFLNNEYWEVGTTRGNKNSGNRIAIFEYDFRSK